MKRSLPQPQDAVLVLLAVVVGIAALAVAMGYGLREAPATSAGFTAVPSEPSERKVRALFLGGSLVSGAARPPGTPSAVEVAAEQLGWEAEVDGRTRAGFTVDAGDVPRISRLLPGDVDPPLPDVVVVQGGEADVDADPEDVAAAVEALATELREEMGRSTRLVVVGPYSPTPTPSDELVEVRDAIRDTAKRVSVHFFDPIAEGWVQPGDVPLLVNPGPRLPTAAGHRKIGRLLADDLATLRVRPSS